MQSIEISQEINFDLKKHRQVLFDGTNSQLIATFHRKLNIFLSSFSFFTAFYFIFPPFHTFYCRYCCWLWKKRDVLCVKKYLKSLISSVRLIYDDVKESTSEWWTMISTIIPLICLNSLWRRNNNFFFFCILLLKGKENKLWILMTTWYFIIIHQAIQMKIMRTFEYSKKFFHMYWGN